jgi:hypothetical protein
MRGWSVDATLLKEEIMRQDNIEEVIGKYLDLGKPEHRYSSFDYCYNYFRVEDDLTSDMGKSCFVLAFYLASWGMFRGSSFLLQKSAKHFVKTIEYINSLEKSLWRIDVDNYNNANIDKLIGIYKNIEELVVEDQSRSVTLVTKIMLGTFGFVPAYDDYFRKSFKKITKCGFSSFNEKSLKAIKQFYDDNNESINKLSCEILTYDFISGNKTRINYPKAKIIDMYGFSLEQKSKIPKRKARS